MSWRSYDEPTPPALAMIELSSIARGIRCGVHEDTGMLPIWKRDNLTGPARPFAALPGCR